MNKPLLPLKECPFCGGEAELYSEEYSGKEYFNIGCLNNNCWLYATDNEASWDNKKSAITTWNTRTPPPPSVKWPEEIEHDKEHCYGYRVNNPYLHCTCGATSWNHAIKACKELNAPKGEACKCDPSGSGEEFCNGACEQPSEKKNHIVEVNEMVSSENKESYIEDLAKDLRDSERKTDHTTYKEQAQYLINVGWVKK